MKRFFLTRSKLAAGFGILSLALVFSACNKFDNDDNGSETPVAGLMAFNLATDQNAVGFAITGNALTNSPLTYTSYTGSYLGIYTGTRTLDAYSFSGNGSLASASATFADGKYYSAFLVGADSSYRNVVVQDNFDSLSSASGQAYIRYINAIVDSVSVNTVTIAANGTNVVNQAAPYASVSEFTAITPGAVTIAVSNTGTVNVNRTITLEAKKIYTILLTGIPEATGDTAPAIKFISNGTLTDEAQQRTTTSAARVSSN